MTVLFMYNYFMEGKHDRGLRRKSGSLSMEEQTVFEKIYEVVKQIPYGKVATYGQVAELAGNKRWARVVGYALHVNPDPEHIPCYRVVNREGRVSEAFAFGGENRQISLLRDEGVCVTCGCVDMERYQWYVPRLGKD